MKRNKAIKRLFWLLIPLALIACKQEKKQTAKISGLPYYNKPDFMPLWLSREDAQKQNVHSIPGFCFINQLGDTITQKDYDGKVYVADFFFTSCPSICPAITHHLKIVADTFATDSDVKFISYSVTPWIDSVPVLKKFADDYGIKASQWNLVTGNQSEIYTLARQSYFAEEEPGFKRDSSEFLHTEHLVLVDKDKHIRGLYNGTVKLEASRLIKDIRILERED